MTKQRVFHSLRVKFVIVLLLALIIGLCSGALVQIVGDSCINNVYMSEEASSQRCRQYMEDFSGFVEDNQLSMHDNALDIIRWAKSQNHIYLMIQEADTIVIDSGWWDEGSYYSAFASQTAEEDSASQDEAESPDAAQPALADAPAEASDGDGQASEEGEVESVLTPILPAMEASETPESTEEDGYEESFSWGLGSAPVNFSDGTFQVYIYDFSEQPLYELVTVTAYAVAIALFIIIMILYHQATIQQIIKLSREVENIAEGNLDGPVTVHSQNEIGILAQHVESMRDSIMREMRAEQDAWNANSDLITRMSHDIRTPLTVLLGFLELLDEGEFSQSETYKSYLGICKKNAYQMKELADKLFQYFLVFGHRDCDLNLEVSDAKVLLEQLIGEHQVLLQEQGWQVENTPLPRHGLIEVDPVYAKRLFDNLFSNIEKYADSARPVTITQEDLGDRLQVTVHNFIAPIPNPVESTNIGLKTCERIVQEMGGTIQFVKTEEEFSVSFTIPFYQEPASSPDQPAPSDRFSAKSDKNCPE